MKRIAWSLVTVLTACAGDGAASPDGGEAHTVRDSAGVEIVESLRPSWSEDERWRLSPEPIFTIASTDGSDETLLLDPASIDIDSRGRIIIADGDQVGWDAILVYDSLGRFELKAGGPGQGPGEYGQLWWASAYRGDSIVGFDMARRRASVFDPSGRYVRQVQVPAVVVPRSPAGTFVDGMDHAYGDGSFLSYPRGALEVGDEPGPAWYRHLLLRQSPDGAAWDTLGTFEIFQRYWDGERATQYWFGPRPVQAVGTTELYFGRGESFEIGRYDAAGRLTRIVRRAHERRPLTEELKLQLEKWYIDRVRTSPVVSATEERIQELRAQLRAAVHPDVLPPYTRALLDEEGNLWVEHYTRYPEIGHAPGSGPTPWSVFDSTGVWLGDVEAPEGFDMQKVTRGRALGFRTDAFGVKEVDVYELLRPGG